jgi:hypothetical protein
VSGGLAGYALVVLSEVRRRDMLFEMGSWGSSYLTASVSLISNGLILLVFVTALVVRASTLREMRSSADN